MANYKIDVNVNPQAQPPSTAPNLNMRGNTSANTMYTEQTSMRSMASLAIGYGALKNVTTATMGMVGEYTGNQQLQQRINQASKLVGYGAQIAISPLVGSIAVGTDVLVGQIQDYVQRRNENANASYLASMRGNKVNGNR